MNDFIALFTVGITHQHHPDKPTVSVVDSHRAHEDIFRNLTPTKQQAVIDALYEQAERFTELLNAAAPVKLPQAERPKKGIKPALTKAEIESRHAQFIALARGIPAHKVAQAIGRRLPEYSWANTTKNHIARAWAEGHAYPQLARLTSGQLDGLFAPLRQKD